MPTGYTCFIEDGTVNNGNDFLLVCARAFGACIEMRDEPLSKSIPQSFEPDTYHEKRIEECRKALAKYESVSIDEIQAELDLKHTYDIETARQCAENQKAINAAYQKILDEVTAWEPPTPDHAGVKKFAIEQIDMCTDINSSYWEDQLNKPKPNASEWISRMIEMLKDDIIHHEQKQAEENERAAKRTEWVQQLRNSLEVI